MIRRLITFLSISILVLSGCKKENETFKPAATINDSEVSDSLKINQIQYLGSHNTYKINPSDTILRFLIKNASVLPAQFDPIEMDYTHVPLKEQFTKYGIRQVELDIYMDINGGRFANRQLNELLGLGGASNISALDQPGIKLLHIPDVDFETHHITFKGALQEIEEWSDEFPEHIPLFVLVELGENNIADFLPGLGFAEVEPWNNMQALQILEDEILDVFDRSDLITPDDVRGNYSTLREAVLDGNWPTIAESRGKIVLLHNNTNISSNYLQGNPNLEGKLLFTSSNGNTDDAAFVMRNDPEASQSQIQDFVRQGFIVRTRSDVGTREARTNDYSRWNAALSSGAHFISTDYYKADRRAGDGTWTSYYVGFDNGLYRLNPETTD